jgi:hypothetical protein
MSRADYLSRAKTFNCYHNIKNQKNKTQHAPPMMMKSILFQHHQISLVLIIVISMMVMIAKWCQDEELVMKCSLETCASFVQPHTVIDGCTMISSLDGSSQAFTFDPMAEDPSCALKTYSDANCTSMISCTDYDVSDTSSVICSSPGKLINPCGTGIDFKIEKAGGKDDDETLSFAMMMMMTTTTTMASTTSLIAAMMMLWSLLLW